MFFDFCLENGLATPFDYGILISNDLAFAYMSFLADVIAKRQELEMFTDVSKYNALLEKMIESLVDLKICIIRLQKPK